jgi:Tol biopolymer transport system component
MVQEQDVAEVKGSGFPIRELLVFVGILIIVQIAAVIFIGENQGPPRIAFMSDREGDFEIFIMSTDGSEVANLTNDPGADGLPGWSSPQGSFAFLTSRGDQNASIYRMDDDGLGLQLLVQDPTIIATTPIWSPDGNWVAYHTGDNVQVNIHIVDSSGNEVREITEGTTLNRFADWSPQGDQLLFLSNRDGQSAVYVVDLEGGNPIRLTDSQFSSAMAVWSPDGEKIAFVTDRDGDVEIYLKDFDTDEVTRLTESFGVDAYPKWSPDGSKIAFLSIRDGNPEIYVMNADGSDQKNLTNSPSQESVQGDFFWSHDGTQILFHTDRDGNPEVYLMDAEGNNPVNLSNDPATDVGSVWVQ